MEFHGYCLDMSVSIPKEITAAGAVLGYHRPEVESMGTWRRMLSVSEVWGPQLSCRFSGTTNPSTHMIAHTSVTSFSGDPVSSSDLEKTLLILLTSDLQACPWCTDSHSGKALVYT